MHLKAFSRDVIWQLNSTIQQSYRRKILNFKEFLPFFHCENPLKIQNITKKSEIHICERPIILQQTHKIYTVTIVTRLATLTPCKNLNSPPKQRRTIENKRAFPHIRRTLQLRRRAFQQVEEEAISSKEGFQQVKGGRFATSRGQFNKETNPNPNPNLKQLTVKR